MPELTPDSLTLTDLIGLGPDAVNDRLPTALLVALARRTVAAEGRKRRRAENARAERAALGDQSDGLDRRARVSAEAAAQTMTVAWADILDVPLHGAGEGTTWGTATADDHEAVADALEREGATYIRTAAMHRRAVLDLHAAGALTLNRYTMGLQ